MKDNHSRNRKSIYVADDLLAEIRKECDTYGITFAKAFHDAWAIARSCTCPLPQGVAIFRHVNRKRKR